MLNKRGDMPTVLIFVMALVLSVAALFSFATFKNDAQRESIELAQMQRAIDFNYQYVLKSSELMAGIAIKEGSNDLRQTFINIAKQRDIQLYGSGNFFGKVESGDFMFNRLGSGYALDIKDLVIFAESTQGKLTEMSTQGKLTERSTPIIKRKVEGVYSFEPSGNKIRRSFNLSMTFDSNGALIEKKVVFNS
jgi:hypothetical protein